MGDVVDLKIKKLEKEFEDFKEKINNYMTSHAEGAAKYEQALSYHLLKHVDKPGGTPKNLGEVLSNDGPLRQELEESFKGHMKYLGIEDGDYMKNAILSDINLTLEELREQYKGRLNQTYDAKFISDVMDSAGRKLNSKLVNAVINELGRLEGSDNYKIGLDHILEKSELSSELPTLSEDVKSHSDAQGYLRQYLPRKLGQVATSKYQADAYKKAS